jgi:hypothetical protein
MFSKLFKIFAPKGSPTVIADAAAWKGMTGKAIQSSALYAARKADVLKPLSSMTVADKAAYRAQLDRELPPDPALCSKCGIVIEPFAGAVLGK